MKCKYILTIGLFVFSQGLMADNNTEATATVYGKVIRSLRLLKTRDLTLPDLVLPDSGEKTSVTLACLSTSTVTTYGNNGGNPFTHGNAGQTSIHFSSKNKDVGSHTGSCAVIKVQGEPLYHYSVSPITASVELASGIILKSINCSSLNTPQFTLVAGFGSAGEDTITCGGEVEIDENASVGDYSKVDALSITVVYD